MTIESELRHPNGRELQPTRVDGTRSGNRVMHALTAEQLAQRIFDLNLLDARQLESLWGEFGTRDVPLVDFQNMLLRRELLTNYQIERVLKGERSGFFYGPYKVLYVVGTGTFARVYRAVHPTTGKVVAVKVLRTRFCSDPVQRDRFCREGEMGESLRHPNIVPILEVHSRVPQPFLIMDFVEGRNLREFVKIQGKLSVEDATRLTADLTSGLAFAFERGITHRDLKLSNVLLSTTGRAQLVDFGLAGEGGSLSDDALIECANPRTIDYVALERATSVRKDHPQSDIYFVGCMYYHMLCGKPALVETRDRLQRLSATRFEQITPIQQVNPEVPSHVAMVLKKSMEMNPVRRYQTPAEMLVDLKKVLVRLRAGASGNAADGDLDGQLANGCTVMVVESAPEMQNLMRDRLKKLGFRVLLTGDPQRALDRMSAVPRPADCLLLSTRDIGRASLEAFNLLPRVDATKDVPAVLLLDPAQQDWQAEAFKDEWRQVVLLPVRLTDLRDQIAAMVQRRAASRIDH